MLNLCYSFNKFFHSHGWYTDDEVPALIARGELFCSQCSNEEINVYHEVGNNHVPELVIKQALWYKNLPEYDVKECFLLEDNIEFIEATEAGINFYCRRCGYKDCHYVGHFLECYSAKYHK